MLAALVLAAAIAGGACSQPPSSRARSESPSAPATAPAQAVDAVVANRLRVTGLEPASGSDAGGKLVRIHGARFTADGPRAVKVYFGPSQGTVLRIEGDTSLLVEAPGGTAGKTVDVRVHFEPGGVMTLPQAFTFVAK